MNHLQLSEISLLHFNLSLSLYYYIFSCAFLHNVSVYFLFLSFIVLLSFYLSFFLSFFLLNFFLYIYLLFLSLFPLLFCYMYIFSPFVLLLFPKPVMCPHKIRRWQQDAHKLKNRHFVGIIYYPIIHGICNFFKHQI
jgi:hypothetical protein